MPNFFDVEKNVKEYIEMCEGMDGSLLIDKLKPHLSKGSAILEIGMGPGNDLEILRESYKVTGSDSSQTFLDLYQQKRHDTDLLLLDAITLKTDLKFDCIYSNKVLHHLERKDLPASLGRQKELLTDGGLIFHSFWRGSEEEEFEGLRFIKYETEALVEIVTPHFEIIETGLYAEMSLNDSIYLLAKKRT